MEQIQTQFKLPSFPYNTNIHPVTGVEHKPVVDGYEPRILSFPSDDLKKWKTSTLDLRQFMPEARYGIFNEAMQRLADGLSQATGQEIDWFNIRDSTCNCYGDYGFFLVRKK